MTRLCWIGVIAGLLWGLGGTPALGQSSADAFFHDAAQQYVTGNTGAARRAVEAGLDVAPSDPRLRALQKKLEQQEKRRGGGRQSPRGQQSQSQRDPSTGDGGQQEQSDASGKESSPQADDASGTESPPREAPGSSSAESSEGQARGRQGDDRAGDRRSARRLSQAQAARLLQALETQEQKLLREVQGESQEPGRVEKDW
ncbi:hypothetical protein [Salinibacter altiplanensis]|uniref:hypothetical protein n=1 Tax=Salinibacter altiplanensis TaxID=1803181 RepID=UPI000C9F0F3C|nr:hypothetical protein [Salinibacter altiplanensis]